ncbi:MAG: N-acetyl-gamma-glutamyl-phosphate reductase [Rickettsiales bacterium]|jgi:N-acetyl-gamma-glutamyl-phosphate reductase|nr:N-acetyl-gamma-glutamyl-phosphate reductase [Rickettsiales bacterium]
MIKVGILGATGYTGVELCRILQWHPDVQIKYLTSVSYVNKKFSEVYPTFANYCDIVCSDGDDVEKIAGDVDVLFLALPHAIASKQITASVLKKCKVIDLGADFRFKEKDVYEKWYGVKHENPELLEKAIYGLCEINREKIKGANLVANPGCYTTCSILSLYPLVKEDVIDLNTIIIDAKSGVTGSGRSVNQDTAYCESAESLKAYKIASHRHTPEIEQELSLAAKQDITLTFTPHLIPMNRGILATIYAKLNKKFEYNEVKKIYEKYYSNEYFVRLLNENVYPETKWVKGSNFFDVSFKIDERTNNIIIIGAIDNLVKGASGQAIQNMNLMFGLNERTAIDRCGFFPA